jgi:hypothetical protein
MQMFFKTLFKKEPPQIVYRNYDALLFLPPVTVAVDKKTRVIEKNGIHVAIMYGETIGVSVSMDLPTDFLKIYYKMTTQINKGNPSNRIVYFAIVYIHPQEYTKKRAEAVRMLLNVRRKYFVFPRWVWLALERHNNITSGFLMNKFDDDNPADFSKEEFDTFGAVGVTYDNYFVFASVARKDYIASINDQISLGLRGL